MNTIIRTLPQLQAAQNEAWIGGLIVTAAAVAIAVAVAFMINWKSNRRCYITRRIWFIVIGLLAPIAFWLYNLLEVSPNISNQGFQSMYESTIVYVTCVSLLLYFIVGVGLMFAFRTTKFGSILGRANN
jgi:hypothetical protein